MDTLAFDQDVRLNSLFFKGDDERVTTTDYHIPSLQSLLKKSRI